MNPSALAGLQRLKSDLPLYSEKCLKIQDFAGSEIPLVLNDAQLVAHEAMERQRREIGMVRAAVLKGRKQGLSTYVGARFYQQCSMNRGRNAQVLAHVDSSSQALFRMVQRYQTCNPLAPQTRSDNAKELSFSKLDSAYQVATAGSKNIGRGDTKQLLHASEFAFWANANEQMAAISNMVADVPGTEIVIESTANGVGNLFHDIWQSAVAGEGLYIPIFIPWMLERRYRAPVPDGFVPSDNEREYMEQYGADLEQIVWRRNKILSYGTGYEWLFDQEFPAVPELAFTSGTSDPLIAPGLVAAAMSSSYVDRHGAVIVGCDPAGDGDDRTAIVWRRGRTVLRVETYEKQDLMATAGLLADYWLRGTPQGLKPDGILIDKGGEGAGIYSRLREQNIPAIGVLFSEKADQDELYINKRAEMWFRMRDWLMDKPVRMPKNMALAADLSAPQSKKHESTGRRQLESKKSMKERGVRSPDIGDALALTFAHSIAPRAESSWGAQTKHYAPATSAGY